VSKNYFKLSELRYSLSKIRMDVREASRHQEMILDGITRDEHMAARSGEKVQLKPFFILVELAAFSGNCAVIVELIEYFDELIRVWLIWFAQNMANVTHIYFILRILNTY